MFYLYKSKNSLNYIGDLSNFYKIIVFKMGNLQEKGYTFRKNLPINYNLVKENYNDSTLGDVNVYILKDFKNTDNLSPYS